LKLQVASSFASSNEGLCYYTSKERATVTLNQVKKEQQFQQRDVRPFHDSMIEALFLCMRLRVYPPKTCFNNNNGHGIRQKTVEGERMDMMFELARMKTRSSR
jgi:hypothetical protein